MNFTQLKSEVIARLGNRTDLDARTEIWINDAYFELLLSPRFDFPEIDVQAISTTVAGQRGYELPNDLWTILSIRNYTLSQRLRQGHWRQFDEIQPTDGPPARYARFGRTVELDPTPDSAYQIIVRYRIRPAELTAGSTPAIGREWHEVLAVTATIKGLQNLRQYEDAMQLRRLLEGELLPRRDVLELEDEDTTTTIMPVVGDVAPY